MPSQPSHFDNHRAALAERFLWNADHVFRGESPLYDTLARGVAADPDLLELAKAIPVNQPPSNVLLGVAHYLLLSGAKHPAADYFPSVGGALPPEQAYPAFR